MSNISIGANYRDILSAGFPADLSKPEKVDSTFSVLGRKGNMH